MSSDSAPTAPVSTSVDPFAVGTGVRVRDGLWKGRRGIVHALSDSVGGGVSLIVELDARSRRGSNAPKTGLIVILRASAIASPPRRGRTTPRPTTEKGTP